MAESEKSRLLGETVDALKIFRIGKPLSCLLCGSTFKAFAEPIR